VELMNFSMASRVSISIPKNPRTGRIFGHAFVDLFTRSESERAIAVLSGNQFLGREVSVQLARKPFKIKIMVSNLPYNLGEKRVSYAQCHILLWELTCRL
jgi:RNA recognition motif-containing protein